MLRERQLVLVGLALLAAVPCCGSTPIPAVDPGGGGLGAGGLTAGSAGSGGQPQAEAGGQPDSGGLGGAARCASPSPPLRGLQVRLNASQGVELEDGRVAAWRNQVDGGPDASQAEAARRPERIEGGINGAPVVHLDGQDDYLSLPYPVAGKTELTLAAVSRTWEYQPASPNADCGDAIGRELNCSGTDQSLLCWAEEQNRFVEQGVFFAVGQREAVFRFGIGKAYPYFKTPFVLEHANDARFVFSLALLDGEDRSLFINGEVPRGRVNYETDEWVELRTSAPAGGLRAEPVVWIGKGRFNPATSFWAGELAELFVYDAALDQAERAALEEYVACSYFPQGY